MADPLGTVLTGGEFLAGQRGVVLLRHAVKLHLERHRQNASSGSAELVRLGELLELAAGRIRAAGSVGTAGHAPAGTSEPPQEPSGPRFSQDVADVKEVVQMLACSREYARRLLRGDVPDQQFQTARKVDGRWQVDRLELQQWRADRQKVSGK